MKKIILIILLILLIAAGVRLVKTRKQTVADLPTARPVSSAVRTVEVETKTVTQTSTFLARLESMQQAEIASKLSGIISEVPVKESMKVSKGELLIRLDDRELQSSIQAVQAKTSAARKTRDYNLILLKRNRALFDAGGLSREKLEASEVSSSTAASLVQELQQNLAGLTSQLDYINIRAPFDGIIGTIFLHQGDLATPGRPLLTLNSLPQKLTFSFVPGSPGIQSGQTVLAQGEKIGTITTLYDDARQGLSVAEIALQNRIKQPNNSYLSIEVATRTETGCAVPVQALLHRPGGTTIMVYKNGRFQEKMISVIARDKKFAALSPCVNAPVAVASEARLSLLPASGEITLITGENNE